MGEELPSWLDNSFFTNLLQKGREESDIKVTNLHVAKAVAVGNNYTSQIYRVRVEYETGEGTSQEEPLIVKIPISKGIMAEAEDVTLYETEPRIYNELLPKFNRLTSLEFGPKSFHCSSKLMIMRDMKEDGFIMCDKLKQLDYSHCKHVVTLLAKYHASSVFCHEVDADLIETIGKEQFYSEESSFYNELGPWLNNNLRNACDVLNELNCGKDIVSYVESRGEHLLKSSLRICKPKKVGLNVLNHGDLWVNNMLFKHGDSDEVVDLKFIDFQIPRYVSPVVDLLYFIWSSANENVRESKLQDLFKTYVDTLNLTLAELGCQERYSDEELQKDLKSCSDWAVLTVYCFVPFMVCDTEYVVNLEDVKIGDFSDDKTFSKMYKSKQYRVLLPQLAEQLHSWLLSL